MREREKCLTLFSRVLGAHLHVLPSGLQLVCRNHGSRLTHVLHADLPFPLLPQSCLQPSQLLRSVLLPLLRSHLPLPLTAQTLRHGNRIWGETQTDCSHWGSAQTQSHGLNSNMFHFCLNYCVLLIQNKPEDCIPMLLLCDL